MKKRAMSDVVTTVIIVALSLVAVAIIWAVVQNLISKNAEQISSSGDFLNLNFKIESVKNDSGNLFVVVKRNAGDGSFDALKFVAIYRNGSSESFTENGSFEILGTKGYSLPISGSITSLSKIECYPVVFGDSGEEITSSIHADYNLDGIVFSQISSEESQEEYNLSEGLIFYLPFNSEGELADQSVSGLTGINYGSVYTNDGISGGARAFDGSNYLDYGESIKPDLESFFISIWFNADSIQYGPLLRRYGGYACWGVNSYYAVTISGDGSVEGSLVDIPGNFDGASGGSYLPHEWHHVVFGRDMENNRVLLYLDGELKSNTTLLASSSISNFCSNRDLTIGAGQDWDWSGMSYFDGKLDEVRIYNRSLSSGEVQALYNLN